MKFDIQMISETIKRESFYTLSGISQNDYRALRAWARSERLIISRFAPQAEITICVPAAKLKPSRSLKGTGAKWVYTTLTEANKSDTDLIAAWNMKASYLRTVVSRFNKTSTTRWKVKELRAGKCILYRDPIQETITETEPLL
jgi:hypothetical protein